MPDQTIAIRLTADGQSFVGEVRASQEELDRLARDMSAGTITRRFTAGMGAAGRAGLQQAQAARECSPQTRR